MFNGQLSFNASQMSCGNSVQGNTNNKFANVSDAELESRSKSFSIMTSREEFYEVHNEIQRRNDEKEEQQILGKYLQGGMQQGYTHSANSKIANASDEELKDLVVRLGSSGFESDIAKEARQELNIREQEKKEQQVLGKYFQNGLLNNSNSNNSNTTNIDVNMSYNGGSIFG